jgi:hypothetical protein
MFPLLTLDESTLFYRTLSDAPHKKRKHVSAINKWASAIPMNNSTRSTTQAPNSASSISSRTAYYATPSVLSNNVKIFSHGHTSSDLGNVEAEPAPALSLYNDGGLSDHDEIGGEERKVAINSPPKGKRQLTSEVFFFSWSNTII